MVIDAARSEPEPIVREIHVDATPETVFEFFVDPQKVTRWLATEATLDPRPGGVCHQMHAGGDDRNAGTYEMRGEFVEVTLTPEDHGTRVRLVHRDLPASEIESHGDGWTGMLDRLAKAVATMAAEER